VAFKVPKIVNRILKIRSEVCFRQGPEDEPETFSLFEDENGGYFIRHWMTRKDGKRRSTKYQLRTEDVDLILDEISNLNVPASPEHELGCDGGYTEIEIGDYGGKSLYRWWSIPPAGWEPLDALVERLLGLLPLADKGDDFYHSE